MQKHDQLILYKSSMVQMMTAAQKCIKMADTILGIEQASGSQKLQKSFPI